MKQRFGYRSGGIGEYTGGDPEEASLAWKALDYEYTELGNEHLLEDVANFLGIAPSSWAIVLGEFKKRHGTTPGIWLTTTKKGARLYKEFGDPYRVPYYKEDIISDLGEDGIFVLDRRGSPKSGKPQGKARKKKRVKVRKKKATMSISSSRR